ncbi:MAG: DUF5666 domain-containing protein [Chloroflexota bacterium]
MDDFISPPEPVQAAAARRAAPMPWARIGLLGVAVAALLAAAILAFGSTAAPSGILAAGTTTDNGSSIVEDLVGAGGPGLRGFGHGGITIKAINGNDLSLETGDGWSRTITVDSGTTYAKGGATITLGDLKVGDQIGFRQTKESDGSFTIDKVAVILPHLGGLVTAIDGSTITVAQRDGTTATIKVTGDTTYKVAGADAKLADVKVGMVLAATGTENSDGSLTAAAVRAGTFGDRGPGGRGLRGPNGDKNGNGPGFDTAPSATGSAG